MSQPNIYEVGDTVVVSGQFSDPTREVPPVDPDTGFSLVNPSDVECAVRTPKNELLSLTVSVSGFVYSATIDVTESGTWWYRIFSPSGQYKGGKRAFFTVPDPRV